ncbi:hypothetical protein [Thioclava sp. F36-7]|uniref:hypothetical protein n=1 Tax=Thioclava sp. F36-7 TaxID=1915317 RepID=UPI0009973BFF|nr:hypothetical protein [Thioclava sp. F36-7]OOY08173.1 hypothetical protein BMI89_15015 [Thioclava sp. F36-7]
MRQLLRLIAIIPLPLIGYPGLSAAQDWTQIAAYSAFIGPQDMRNSKGAALRSLGAALQQDRANFHRFGLRDARDESDPVFADRASRARIPAMVEAGGDTRGSFTQMVRAGQPFGVYVFVCGYGRTPSVIYIAGWGEDHSGCY